MLSKHWEFGTGWPGEKSEPSQFTSLQNQQHEWMGDGLLKFYTRLYLVLRMNTDKIGILCPYEVKITTNAMLARFARAKGIEGGANQVERLIFRKWVGNTLMAKEFVFQICDYYFENQ